VATNRDLRVMVDEGLFRKDLYYRLVAHHCHVLPLRERLEDIPFLVEHFVAESAETLQKRKPACTRELMVSLCAFSFPGNVRELQAMVHEAVARNTSPSLSPVLFRSTSGALCGDGSVPFPAPEPGVSEGIRLEFVSFPSLKEVENRLVSHALARAKGNQSMAAALLGLTRQAFNNRIMRKKASGKS
jgi:DNA-binding NtrC family response regulator